MGKYREQIVEKIGDLKKEFEIVKSEIVKDISSATPNKVSTMTSTYSSRISELCVISGKISSLLDQLRAFDYYNK